MDNCRAAKQVRRSFPNIAKDTTFRRHVKVYRQKTGQPLQNCHQIIQSTNHSYLDNVPTLQLSTCVLSDHNTVTVRRSNSAVFTRSCMLLVDNQIMMLHVFVIIHLDDHLSMY